MEHIIPALSETELHEGDFLLLNTLKDHRRPCEFRDRYHVHILCKGGKAKFCFNERTFHIGPGDLVIWQMSSEIYDTEYTEDFDADFLLASWNAVGQFNPEMVWAVKGFVFIKLNPVFHLTDKEWSICENDFAQFRMRLERGHIFRADVIGRLFQIFLFDMWDFYSREIDSMKFGNIAATTFLRFLHEVAVNCRKEREVAYYSDKLCITPKYLSEICRKVSNISASEWIGSHARHEIIKLLNDTSLTLANISDIMNFSHQSHFSRYVKKVLGVSPSEYRSKLEEER